MLLNHVVLATKLSATIWQRLLRPVLLHFGFPDQLVTDQGGEWAICIFACFYVWLQDGRAIPNAREPHKIVTSTRNTRVEKFNFETNMRCLSVIRALIDVMEAANLLDKQLVLHVHVFRFLMCPLLEVGLVRLLRGWNRHKVATIAGRPGSGGRPVERMAERPHPGGQLPLQPDMDVPSLYDEHALGAQV
tara:strand:- start:157 stop:726 length:570 start_codon:yes stop_codon:yes gene_type:complete